MAMPREVLERTLWAPVPRALPRPAPWAVAARKELWEHLPAWMFLVYGVLLLNTLLTNLTPARPELAFITAFPLGVFAAYYVVRAWKAHDVRRRPQLLAWTLSLTVGLPLAILAVHRPSPLSPETLRAAYEISNLLWTGALLYHAFKTRPSRAKLFFGAGLLYGALLENGGILLGYFEETRLTLTFRPFVAPLSTMIGWCGVLYMAFFVVWNLRRWLPWLGRSAIASALLVALVATLLDVAIDPVATAAGCWVWDRSLPPFLGAVPLVNFIAWMCAIAPFGYILFRYQGRAGIPDDASWHRRHVLFATGVVPLVLVVAATAFLVGITLTEGLAGPSWGLLMKHASGAFEACARVVGLG